MMIPPPHSTGSSVLDVIAQTTRQQTQWLLAPQFCSSPSALSAPPTTTSLEQLSSLADSDGPLTDHALLVLLGLFAQHLGLLQLLSAVPLAQKTVEHRPQSKLIEFLVAILAGLDHLQQLNLAPSPLVRDTAVQQAWGQSAFAHYSSVSRTLAAADADTLQAVIDALTQVSRPFIDRELLHLLRNAQPLIIDIDLTGRPVSPTSTDYPDAAFGWMDDAVAKGYQSVISSLSGGPCGRLLLTSQRYDGRATSADSLRAAVSVLEQTLKLHPRRRAELVQAQIDELSATLAARSHTHAECLAQQLKAVQRMSHLAAQSAPAARLVSLQQRLERLAARARRLEAELWQLRQQQAERQAWLAQLTSDNQALSAAVEQVIRLDAGFATDANLAWLIEMGYTVLTKAHSGHTTKRLQRQLGNQEGWTRVGANAEAIAVGAQRIGAGRYALQALQVRYQLPQGERYTTLLYYGERCPPAEKAWFEQYNRRQTIEAGIKENKAVFTMRRPLVRSEIGMQLQEQFALFGANFVRWAAAWAREQLREVPAALEQALSEVKTLVRVVAHSRARLVETVLGCGLVFDSHSAFAGAVLILRGQVAYQEVLPLFSIEPITSSGVT